jgi:hypothetical protein
MRFRHSIARALLAFILVCTPASFALAMATPTAAPPNTQTLITLYTQLLQLLQQELSALSSSATTTATTTATAPTATSAIPAWLQAWDQFAPKGYVPGFGGGGGIASSNNSNNSTPAPYVAKAVHFDGLTQLINMAMSVTDGPYTAYSFWVKSADYATNYPQIFVVNPTGDASTSPYNFGFGSASGNGALQSYISNDANDPPGGPVYMFHVDTDIVPTSTWQHFLIATKTNLGTGLKEAKIYRNDVDIGTISRDDGTSYPTGPNINGRDFWIGSDGEGDGLTGDFADFQFWTNVPLLDASGDIPTSTRRLFIDANGKPVDPSVAKAALGTPDILLSGDASSFGTNQGRAGTFNVTKVLLCTGHNGPGSISLPGAIAGQQVFFVVDVSNYTNVTSDFENTISVNNQIQQTSATDFSSATLNVISPGTLTNATTSPSD